AIIELDAQLDLGLRDDAATRGFETSPFNPSTDKHSATTAAGTARVPITAGSAYYAPDTNVVTRQPRATTPATGRANVSKPILLLAITVMVLATAVVLIFQKYGGRAQSTAAGESGVEKSDPPRVPEGMVPIPEGSFMMGRNLTDEEKNFTVELQG